MKKWIDPRIKQHTNLIKKFGQPASLDELGQLVISAANDYGSEVIGLVWQVEYSNNVACTHDAPVGEETNWGGRDSSKPTHFPGFTGRVWVRYKKSVGGVHGSDPLRAAFTYPGTGGFGSYSGPWDDLFKKAYSSRDKPNKLPEPVAYSWDYKIFLQDWPLIQALVERERLAYVLRDEQYPGMKHHFEWHAPETVEEDKKYLTEEFAVA